MAFMETAEIENDVKVQRDDVNVAAATVAIGATLIAGGLSTTALPVMMSTITRNFG